MFFATQNSATDQRDEWGNIDTETWRSESAFLGRSVIAKTEIGERPRWASKRTSTQQVRARVLGQQVTGEVVASDPTADYGAGPRDELVLDGGGARYRVDEDDLED